MDYSDSQPKYKTKYYLVGAIIIVVLLSTVSWLTWKARNTGSSNLALTSKQDYLIPGVPSINLFDLQGNLRYVSPSDTTASTLSVLEYWNPGANNFVGVSSFIKADKERNGDTIRRLVEGFYGGQYTFRQEKLSIDDLYRYINPEVKTPLLFLFPLTKDQPSEVVFHPLTVLIGIKKSEQKLVMHNFYLGNNYEISFADFEKSWESMRPDERNAFFVIQPVDLKGKLAEINSRKMEAYPARTKVMDDFVGMLSNYAVSRAMDTKNNSYLALNYALKVENDSRFQSEVRPSIKVDIYTILANSYLKKGDLDLAKQYALKAVELDHDLDKPFGDWPGIESGYDGGVISQNSWAYRSLGDVYMQTNEFDLAKQNYEKAVQIKPADTEAAKRLDLVKLKLAGSK